MENEKRLIYANVAIEKCNKLLDNACSCPNTAALIGVKIVRDQILSECETGCHTVDAVEVVHGRWIRTHFVSPVWKCSECGEQINRVSMIGYNYCPNCGAKMYGGTTDD